MSYERMSAHCVFKVSKEFCRKANVVSACINADINIPKEIEEYFKENGYGINDIYEMDLENETSVDTENEILSKRYPDPDTDVIEIELKNIPKNAVAIQIFAEL